MLGGHLDSLDSLDSFRFYKESSGSSGARTNYQKRECGILFAYYSGSVLCPVLRWYWSGGGYCAVQCAGRWRAATWPDFLLLAGQFTTVARQKSTAMLLLLCCLLVPGLASPPTHANLTQLALLEQTAHFSMRVIVLTMNRPDSLTRLLNSINNTFFEYPGDRIELEIHVDKAHGLLHDECVRIAQNWALPPGRGSVSARVAQTNHGLRTAWFDSWEPQSDTEHAIIVEDDLEVTDKYNTRADCNLFKCSSWRPVGSPGCGAPGFPTDTAPTSLGLRSPDSFSCSRNLNGQTWR